MGEKNSHYKKNQYGEKDIKNVYPGQQNPKYAPAYNSYYFIRFIFIYYIILSVLSILSYFNENKNLFYFGILI